MGNRTFWFLIISLLFSFQYSHSQNAYTILSNESDSTFIIDFDTIIEARYWDGGSVYSTLSDIDDNVNDIFSEQMDDLTNSWQIKNSFNFDSTEVKNSEWFPRNLPDSVYIQRLMDAEQVFDLSYNKVVKRYIQMYTEKRRNQVEVMLGLSAYYFPIFEETLDKYNMPLELKYLPIIESALNPVARSRAGANGLWQFMYGTGKQLKLEISTF
ncbi:MAG: transglycosylase SLT domain-containing protein, partial [Draconibacterium sp.]|nr:transglycosylase SLT domain-containing protein [Draconibacterium sp.]